MCLLFLLDNFNIKWCGLIEYILNVNEWMMEWWIVVGVCIIIYI